jgi:hypothetical protein
LQAALPVGCAADERAAARGTPPDDFVPPPPEDLPPVPDDAGDTRGYHFRRLLGKP